MIVRCPYCGAEAKLMDSAQIYGRSYGNIWACIPCDAYVGVHKNRPGNEPLGRLANGKLRALRQKAHAAFDPLWKDGHMTRSQAYFYLQRILGIRKSEAHIARFDEARCRELLSKISGNPPGATR